MVTRRQFLTVSATALIAAHADLAGGYHPSMTAPRILSLDLQTAAPLEKMKDFYHRLLGLPVVEDLPGKLSIAAGKTRLTFTPAKEGSPFYHFAFNIPENKILAALDWQKERTPLLPIPAALRDSRFPDDVVDYNHWNAHSVFFFDPAENVVEYIARHDLKNSAKGPFTTNDILYASEIAFVVDDVAAACEKIKPAAGVEQYRGASDQFAALGDENGLLLVMKRGRMISFEAPHKKNVTVFPISATVRGSALQNTTLSPFPYHISLSK